MSLTPFATRRSYQSLVAAALLLLAAPLAWADQSHANAGSQDELWRRSVDLVTHGEFSEAAEVARHLSAGGEMTATVRQWLAEYEKRQAERRELDRQDFEKKVEYAKGRYERKEYVKALDRALQAAEYAADREEYLRADWLGQLATDSLAEAERLAGADDWKGAWEIYWRLTALFEREPKYAKLERQAVTHIRLDVMFEEGRNWQEPLEKVRWEDAQRAIEYVAGRYFPPDVDFQEMAIAGLEHVILLTNSTQAQKVVPGLDDELDRQDFQARVRAKLDQVREAQDFDHRAMTEVYRRVVKDINQETVRMPEPLLVSELMQGSFQELDDFTTIIWPSDIEEFDKHTRGDFIGVGISIIKRAEMIEVAAPIEDSPAYSAGVQSGDLIVKVDGNSIEGFTLSKVVDVITGPEGTKVTLTIRRGEEEFDLTLERRKIKIPSVKGITRREDDPQRWNFWLDEPNGIAYVRLTNFQGNSAEDLHDAIAELYAKGLKGLVLDLRADPGGLLNAAYDVTSLFLPRGSTVVTTRGRNPRENQDLYTVMDGPFQDVPMVVLVDGASASASEIVSGALKDNGRAIVVGERTFGKFSVQNLIPLNRATGAALKITTARYYLPSGVSLHRDDNAEKWGVEPDIQVTLSPWERMNVYQLRRDADRLNGLGASNGPNGEPDNVEGAPGEAAPDAEGVGAEEGAQPAEPGARPEGAAPDAIDGDSTGPEKVEVKDDFPEDPDVNNRPKVDPQIDTALLVLRVKLLGQQYKTLAQAVPHAPEAANP